MTYSREMRNLLKALKCEGNIYVDKKPVRATAKITPLTAKARREVEKVSTERGYRRFIADVITSA